MDFDYEGAEDFGGRILWPRIAVFVFAAFLVFFLGRCTGGGSDVDQAQFDELVVANSEAESALTQKDASIAQLQQELIDARASGQTPTTPGTDGVTPAPGATDDATSPPTGTNPGTYEVQEGDTLSTIAQQVYGDPLGFGPIAEANGLTGGQPIQVGQVLQIPANPDAGE